MAVIRMVAFNVWRHYWRLALILIIMFSTTPLLAEVYQQVPHEKLMSEEDRVWIASHPIITYSITDRWPQEIVRGNRHTGLTRTVLNEIEKRTGLQFVFIPADQALIDPPMLLPAVMERLLTPEERARWRWTQPWTNAMPIVVGKLSTVHLRSLTELEGQRVGVVAGTDYVPWLQLHHPAIKLVQFNNVMSALQSVDEGKTSAALGSNLVLLPVLQRHFVHRLAITSQIPEMASGLSMAVSPDSPQLQIILNKILGNISADDVQKMYLRWATITEVGTPSLQLIAWQYRYSLMVIGVLLVLLLLTLGSALRSKRRAQQSEQAKSEFLAVMSHEIRTPMNAIIASLELQQKPSDPVKQQEYQALALSASQDMLELLNNVLDHSKISQQQMPLQLAPCDLSALLSAVCDSQRPSAERKGLALMLQLEPALQGQWFEADAHRLRQIVNNLLSNAVKFTDSGKITLMAHWQVENVMLSVNDTGIGIALSDQQLLFQAWQQAENSGARLRGGSGLGLYLSRQLTRQMGGELTLHSEPGSGSTFSCTLPLISCDPVAAEQTSSTLHVVGAGISVLVVEDHPANQQVIAAQLHQLGCEYELAESAEQAMRLLADENYYDLMLLDCNLPGKDGYWLATQIRQFERAQQRDNTPLIAISAVSSAEHRQHCLECGMDDVLVKPIRLNELARKLGLFYPGNATALKVNTEMQAWLKQDLDHFAQACDEQNQQNMIYFIHRVRGVALMYQLAALANISDEIETHLRQQCAIDVELMAHWRQQLQQHSPLREAY